MGSRQQWQRLQAEAHGAEHEYRSPHLRSGEPRDFIVGRLREVVAAHVAGGRCTVLDMGAGHGSYTAELLAAGATRVICTEMSKDSAEALRRRFAADSRVDVVFDPDGENVYHQEQADLVCMISLLHHIPDYAAALRRVRERVAPGGSLVTFQDPDFYPRRKPLVRFTSRASYVLWRLTQGGLWEGAKSVARRRTGHMDETNPRDMVEYHVVREGVDEQAAAEALRPHFATVELVKYWSDHGRSAQRLIGRTSLTNTFGIVARGRRR